MSKTASERPELFIRSLADEIAQRRPDLVEAMWKLEAADSDITPVGDDLRREIAALRPEIVGFDRISLKLAVRLLFRQRAGLPPLGDRSHQTNFPQTYRFG
ncbi:hypothetical protein [Variibacter gotjawalensis]|uniref:hypothetical protein n=1 Tax=Variibacter gotjawalensis TaxID=1333996 RepID=UPI00102B0E32|nr:hypothetical protein [Variibacter gotjawalensis]NIK45883.1 hypothetical protein [Variibacter gotjawalensis]